MLYNFMVDPQRLDDLLLRLVSLAFDQRTDSVDLSSVTRPPGPRQISMLGVPAIEGCGLLLDCLQRDHIGSINFLQLGEHCLVGDMLKLSEVIMAYSSMDIPVCSDADNFIDSRCRPSKTIFWF
jgi:hypothetical protein